jgi:hypothetical protein
MNEPREKVLSLVAAGKISAGEGELLLGALKPSRPRLATWLLSPFELAPPAAVWGTALAVSAGSLWLRSVNVHFDGALDLHVFDHAASWRQALLQQAVAWPLVALVLWLLGLVSRQPAALPELVGFVGAARLPYLLAAGVAALAHARSQGGAGAAGLLGLAVVLPLIVWGCVLLHAAFRTAAGKQGRRLTLTYFAAILLAEVASKLVLGALA